MQCPYCGAELIYEDYYGTGRQEYYYGTAGNGIYYPSTFKKLGDIYKCQNSFGFNTEEEALGYAQENKLEFTDWQVIVCESDIFNGHFYTDEYGNLHEGYPC